MKKNKAFNTFGINTLSADALMLDSERVARLIEQFGWRVDHRGVLSRHLQNTIKTYLIFSIR